MSLSPLQLATRAPRRRTFGTVLALLLAAGLAGAAPDGASGASGSRSGDRYRTSRAASAPKPQRTAKKPTASQTTAQRSTPPKTAPRTSPPAPSPASSEPTLYSVSFFNQDIHSILRSLNQYVAEDIVASPNVSGTVTIALRDKTLEEVLQSITTALGTDFLRIGDTYYLAPVAELKTLAAKFGERRILALQNAPAPQVATLLQDQFPYLTVTAEGSGRAVIVRGREQDIEEAVELLRRVDRPEPMPEPPPPAPEKPETRLIRTKRPASEVADALRSLAPDVQISPLESNVLAIEAVPSRQDALQSFISVLDEPEMPLPPEAPRRVVDFYRVKYISTSQAVEMLEQFVPELVVDLAPEAYVPPVSLGLLGAGGGAGGGLGGLGGGGLGGLGAGGGPGGGAGGGQQSGLGSGSELERASRIVMSGLEEQVQFAMQLLQRADVAPPQVEIDAKIIEVRESDSRSLGVDWTIGGSVSFSPRLDGAQFGPRTGGLDLSARLLADIEQGRARVLANPKQVVTENDSASIFIGDVVRFRVLNAVTDAGQQIFNVQEVPSGISLSINPRVNEDGVVTLSIVPVVSTSTIGAGGIPQSQTRLAQTSVRLREGELFSIGGLIRDEDSRTTNRVPLLSNIPLVGKLFRSDRRLKVRTEVVILIKTRILRD